MPQVTTLDLFADELRRARTQAGLSQEALGQAINYSGSLIAAVETGRRIPSRDFAKRIDETLATGGRLGRIQVIVGRDAVLPWFRQWVAVEQEAVLLRTYQVAVLPGLLQTEAYARAVLAGGALLTPEEVEKQVAARLERQRLLERESPPHLISVLDETVLRRPVGGPAVMREQLRHLVEVAAAHPRVRLHIVPAGTGAYAGLNGPFVLATSSADDDLVFLDTPRRGMVLDHGEDVRAIRQSWEAVRAEALSHPQSIELIEEVAESWI